MYYGEARFIYEKMGQSKEITTNKEIQQTTPLGWCTLWRSLERVDW